MMVSAQGVKRLCPPVMWKRVLMLSKMSCLVPVPKMPHPIGSKDYRPVAMTSHLPVPGETFPGAVPNPWSGHDSLQSAFQTPLGVEDCIIYLPNRILLPPG